MGLSGGNRFSVRDFSEVFRLRDSNGAPYLLIGGQAVNYWAERYLGAEPELQSFLPFTSEDIDFKGAKADVLLIAEQLGRKPVLPAKVEMTAFAGAVSISIRNRVSTIEVVRNLPGVSNTDLDSLAIEAEFEGEKIRVIDPITLTANKLKLASTVCQEQRQDITHLKIMLYCVRGFLRELLVSVEAGEIPAAGWLGAANRIRKLAASTAGRNAGGAHGINWSEFLPVVDIARARNPKLQRFRELQLPRWRW